MVDDEFHETSLLLNINADIYLRYRVQRSYIDDKKTMMQSMPLMPCFRHYLRDANAHQPSSWGRCTPYASTRQRLCANSQDFLFDGVYQYTTNWHVRLRQNARTQKHKRDSYIVAENAGKECLCNPNSKIDWVWTLSTESYIETWLPET